jgi:hypothetical protein
VCVRRVAKIQDPNYEQAGGYQFVRRISTEKRPRVYECYWAHFAAEIHLSE